MRSCVSYPLWPAFLTLSVSLTFFTLSNALPIATSDPATLSPRRSYDIPFVHSRSKRRSKRAGLSGSSGLGDNSDLLYAIPVSFENAQLTAAFHLDTGSSDLWVTTDKCTSSGCASMSSVHYPSSALSKTSPPVPIRLAYGDSKTGTFARGNVFEETVTVAGITMPNQHFGAIDETTNPVVAFGTSGIFGLGFPSGSKVQEVMVDFENDQPSTTDAFVDSMFIDGPLLSRLSMTGNLEHPMFSVTLQRATIDTAESAPGLLTVGKLPDGTTDDEITWVPVKLYKESEGGLAAPTFAKDEVYPYRWEVDIDGVFLDGEELPPSDLPVGPGITPGKVSALIDTGNSLIRGPSDVVDKILSTVSPTYSSNKKAGPILPCSVPRTLAFKIGGKMFPVDPRDFIGPTIPGDATNCVADNLVSTDRPSRGALFSWSLGDPFMKSNLVAFHYGNLTHPSQDPPRMGFKSLVPNNANELLQQAIVDAKANGGNFESTFVAAPTQSAHEAPGTTITPGVTNTKSVSSPAPTESDKSASKTTQVPQQAIVTSTVEPSASVSDDNGATNTKMSLGLVLFTGLASWWLLL